MRKLSLQLCSALGLVALFLAAQPTFAQGNLPPAFDKKLPESLHDLQEIEKHVQSIVDKVLPSTVCLRIGQSQGSGVIINREGYILTAGHVSGEANRDAIIILHDGRRIKGKTLGANNGIDSGMVRITEKADFASVEMAKSAKLKKGQWCLALGHPGGYKPGRVPVVRLGRLQEVTPSALVSDCALVGGDSGGPLFDMHGRVIGIHSRIGGKITSNVHVPIDTYHETWTRLAAAEVWGGGGVLFTFGNPREGKPNEAYLGVRAVSDNVSLKVEAVTPNSPAEKAGIQPKDTILKIDNQKVATLDDMARLLKVRTAGARITIHVQRGDETLALGVVLGKRTN